MSATSNKVAPITKDRAIQVGNSGTTGVDEGDAVEVCVVCDVGTAVGEGVVIEAGEGVVVGVAVGVGLGVGLAVGVGEGVGEREDAGDGLGVGLGVGVAVGAGELAKA